MSELRMAVDRDVIIGDYPSPTEIPLRVSNGELGLPGLVMSFLGCHSIKSAFAFISFLRATPEAMGQHMFWTPQEVRTFTARVLWAIRREYPRGMLIKRPARQFAYGAVIPNPFEG